MLVVQFLIVWIDGGIPRVSLLRGLCLLPVNFVVLAVERGYHLVLPFCVLLRGLVERRGCLSHSPFLEG